MSKFISQHDAMQAQLLEQVTAEMTLTMMWLEDTLQPSIDLSRLKGMVYDMQADVKLFEDLNGVTDKTKKSATRIESILELINRLDKVAVQNNTFQLIVRHTDLEMVKVRQENKQLKTELEAVKKAWEQSE